MKIATLTAAVLMCASVALAQAPQSQRAEWSVDSVTVTGTGRVTSTPDRVTFTAGVETQAATVEQAVKMNNEQMATLIAALKKAGATDKDLRTTNFTIFPQQVYEEGQRPRITGFQASNSVMVSRQSAAEAGKLLTVAVSNGANQVSGLTFSNADTDAIRNRGLQGAMTDARTKAQLLATAAGRTLGRAIVINEATANTPPPMPYVRSMAMESKQADVPIEGGASEEQFTVTVTFELR